MSNYIRDGKKILHVTPVEGTVDKHHVMVFSSINQAKLYNRTQLGGKATVEPFKANLAASTQTMPHVAK